MSQPTPGPSTKPRRLVVSLVVIGNEVLSGKVEEQNARFLTRRLRELGARLKEVVFVEDEVEAIAEAVARVSARSDCVLTSGGVGPTHDDVTVAGVARALGVPVVEDPAILELIERHMSRTLAAAPGARRLARVPQGARLIRGNRIPWPVIQCQNTWLFPGIPMMLEVLFDEVCEHFAGSPAVYSEFIELMVEESVICEALDALVLRHASVEIGSYPRREAGAWHLRLTFDGTAGDAVHAAREDARVTFAEWAAR